MPSHHDGRWERESGPAARRAQPAPDLAPDDHRLLQLQRAAGNRATAGLIGRLNQRLLQRVGEKKLSFVGRPKAQEQALVLLREALEELRLEDMGRKDVFETDVLEKMPPGAAHAKERQKTVLQAYPKVLAGGDAVARLAKTKPFAGGLLELGESDAAGDFIEVLDKDGTIADLSVGEASFLPALEDPTKPPPSDRVTFSKLDKPWKEYVEDSRAVATRRFAFCEKSFYQFMELVSTGWMSGRYQLLQHALRETPKLLAVTPGLGGLLSPDEDAPLETIGVEQLAVLHQWMGSGMQQRGLSLTSTPREHAVFGNEGESFREADGVRIKIDLFKVPHDVIMINHYAAAGVKDDLSMVNPSLEHGQQMGKRRAKYAYAESVQKNREVYLEYLDPDWIVGLEAHGVPPKATSQTVAPAPTGAALVQQVGKEMGHADYVKGFEAAVRAIHGGGDAPDTSTMTGTPFAKGVSSGTGYMRGFVAGLKERPIFDQAVKGTKDALRQAYEKSQSKTPEGKLQSAVGKASQLRAKKPTNAAELAANMVCDILKEQGIEGMNRIDPTGWLALTSLAHQSEEYDIHWVGWAHGARGEQPHAQMDADFY